MKKRIRIHGLIIFLALVLVFLFSGNLFPGQRKKSQEIVLDIVGIILILLGYFLRMIARGYKAEMNPNGKTLVTTSLYALVRNPMYLGTLLIGLGINLVLFSWWFAFVFLAVYSLIYIPQINQEEARLSQRFPDAFKDYCKAVPKYFPNIITLFRKNPRKYLSLKPGWIKKEIFSLCAVIVFIIAIKILKHR